MPQEGTYAGAAQTPATLNRFQRTRLEEEEDLRKAIEASLAESENQGTSLANSGQDARTNETVPLVASDQPVDETMTTTIPSTPSASPEESGNKGFVDGLVSSVFEASRSSLQTMSAGFVHSHCMSKLVNSLESMCPFSKVSRNTNV